MADRQPDDNDETVIGGDIDLDALVAEIDSRRPDAAPASGGASDDLEMVELDTASDLEMVELDAEPEPPVPAPAPAAPLPDWLGDDLPVKPVQADTAIAVNLADGGEEPELDLRHEFQRETAPDPSFVIDDDVDEIPKVICGKCGTRNEVTRRTCRNCGDRLKIPEEYQQAE